MSTKLQTLVQRMINDGRSENEIASVIRLFNNKSKASALKQTVDPGSERPLTLEEQPQYVPTFSSEPYFLEDGSVNPKYQAQVLIDPVQIGKPVEEAPSVWESTKNSILNTFEFSNMFI